MKLLLSPHNDDEALFASFIALRERPLIVTVLDGGLRKHFVDPEVRVAESAAAAAILGCDYAHLGFPCSIDDWSPVPNAVLELVDGSEIDRVWAPMPEPRGHRHHNRVAAAALGLFGAERVSFYSTYMAWPSDYPTRTMHGHLVAEQEGWSDLKRRALDCYESQIAQAGTRMHFEAPFDEFEASSIRLNLGGGLNPIEGCVNLDKSNGWQFEEGLGCYPDASVEAVTVSHALMYVDLNEWPGVFAEIARVLRPDGTVRITEDAIGKPGSSRPRRRPGAALETKPELVLEHLAAVGLEARVVDEDETGFLDSSLIQQNYGAPPDVFHVEAVPA